MRLNDFQIMPNFNLREFQCPCCHCVLLNRRLAAALQTLRDLLNAPIVLTSGYRCAAHNRAVGGAEHSLHRQGLAADTIVSEEKQAEFCSLARRAGFTRAIGYPERGFVYLEVSQ